MVVVVVVNNRLTIVLGPVDRERIVPTEDDGGEAALGAPQVLVVLGLHVQHVCVTTHRVVLATWVVRPVQGDHALSG